MNMTRIFRSSTCVTRFVGILFSACILSTASSQGQTLQITNFVCEADTFKFGFQAPAGLGYTLQRSTNLLDWVNVDNVSAYAVLSLPRDAQVPSCFFRLQSFPELIANGAAVPGEIGIGGSGWYRFEVSSSATYTFTVVLGTLTDSLMWLYGPNSQTMQITFNDDAIGFASRISITLFPGTYYIRVRGWDTEAGTYSVQVTQ